MCKFSCQKFFLGSVKYLHQIPLRFPAGKACTLKNVKKRGISPGLAASDGLSDVANLRVCKLWEAPLGVGSVVEPLLSRRAQRISLGTAVYRVARWLILVSSFPPGQNPSQSLLVFFVQRAAAIIPLHSGYNSGKWFTKAEGDNCLSFVSHLGWAADVSDCSHFCHDRAPVTIRWRLTVWQVGSRDTSLLSWFCRGL